MTILVLQELNPAQLDELELGALDPRSPSGKDFDDRDSCSNDLVSNRHDACNEERWNPKRKPSQPAVMPWWQKAADPGSDRDDGRDAIWRKVSDG